MTPSQLRVRAEKNIESADKLLDGGDTDNACNLAGQAVELALKARYCTRHSIKDFPETFAAIKAAKLQEAAIHDLDTLLSLAKGIEIPKYAGIDWKLVCEWDVAQRYDPVGTISKEQAASRVEESATVVDYLDLHELLERLSHVRADLEEKLSAKFDFFLLDVSSPDEISLVVGAEAIWRMGQEVFTQTLKDSVATHADGDLVAVIDSYKLISPWSGMFNAYLTGGAYNNIFALVNNHIAFGNIIKAAYFIPAAGFGIGNFNSPSRMISNLFL